MTDFKKAEVNVENKIIDILNQPIYDAFNDEAENTLDFKLQLMNVIWKILILVHLKIMKHLQIRN